MVEPAEDVLKRVFRRCSGRYEVFKTIDGIEELVGVIEGGNGQYYASFVTWPDWTFGDPVVSPSPIRAIFPTVQEAALVF